MTVQSLQKKTYSDDLLSGVFPSLRTRQGENLPHLKATVIANPKGEAILSRRQDCFGFASLKLGISDSVVEVSLEGTIRLKEAELPRLMGEGEHLATRGKIHLVKRSSCFAEEFTL